MLAPKVVPFSVCASDVSGLRQFMTMRKSDIGLMVFCYGCRNRWYSENGEPICPKCGCEDIGESDSHNAYPGNEDHIAYDIG
jgi:hypothetical protein